jgi:hypothetical protein
MRKGDIVLNLDSVDVHVDTYIEFSLEVTVVTSGSGVEGFDLSIIKENCHVLILWGKLTKASCKGFEVDFYLIEGGSSLIRSNESCVPGSRHSGDRTAWRASPLICDENCFINRERIRNRAHRISKLGSCWFELSYNRYMNSLPVGIFVLPTAVEKLNYY